jgi:hypothetical protein
MHIIGANHQSGLRRARFTRPKRRHHHARGCRRLSNKTWLFRWASFKPRAWNGYAGDAGVNLAKYGRAVTLKSTKMHVQKTTTMAI